MTTKTIISLQFNGHRFQVVEVSHEWNNSVRYDLLQDRRKLRSNMTKMGAAYELVEIIRRNFCYV